MAISIAGVVMIAVLIGSVAIVVGIVLAARGLKAAAGRAGYASIGEYLRAVPRTDEEKQDAVDLALKGLVISIVGLVFPPFVLIGLFPLYYGVRKLIFASMGLGLVEDADPPQA